MRYKLVIFGLLFAVFAVIVHAQAGTTSSVVVDSGLYFYGDGPCNDNSNCTTGLCINQTCACVTNSDCWMIGICQVDNTCRDTWIYTEFDQYGQHMEIPIYGFNFTFNGVVNLSILNTTGSVIYSTLLSTSSNGTFLDLWNSSDNPFGDYTIKAYDLNASITEQKVISIVKSYGFAGRIINSSDGTTASSVFLYHENGSLIAVDDEVYSFSLDYNVEYDIIITPTDVAGLEQILIHVIENQGPLGDIMGIDDTPEANSNFTDFEVLIGIYPIITQYEYMEVTLSHSKHAQTVYKCIDWDFNSRICLNDSSWADIASTTGTETIITLYKGDPGIGISSTKPDSVSDTGTRGGAGGRYSPCIPEWECSDWKECIDGVKTRTCTDKWDCNDVRNKPIDKISCYVSPEVEEEKETIKEIIRMPFKPIFALFAEEDAPNRFLILFGFLAIFVVLFLIIKGRKILILTKSCDKKEEEVTLTVKNVTKIIRQNASNIFVIDEINGEAKDFRFINKQGEITDIKDISKGVTLHKFIHSTLYEKGPIMVRFEEHAIFVLKEGNRFKVMVPGEEARIVYSSNRCDPKGEVKYKIGVPPHDPAMEKILLNNIIEDIEDEKLDKYHDVCEKLEPLKESLKRPKKHHEKALKHKVDTIEGVLTHIVAKNHKKTRKQRIDAELDDYLKKKNKQ